MSAAPAAARVVVVRLPNPAGDVVQSTPALRAIRAAFPGARVVWAGREPALELLGGLAERDDVMPVAGDLDRGAGAPRRLGRLWREAGADVVVVMPGSVSSALAARASGAAVRVGVGGRGRRLLLTHVVPVPAEPHAMRAHYAALAAAVGGRDDGAPPRLVPTPAGEAAAAARLAASGATGRPLLAVSPGAAFGPSKVYPPRLLADAVARVRAATGLLPLVLCGPGEEALAAETADRAGEPVLRTDASPARWPETKSLLARAALLLTPDAGPRHVAAALGVPVVALLGPTDPRWSSDDATVLRTEGLACLACHERVCPVEGHPCMEALDPATVADACLSRLASSPAGAAPGPGAR